MILDAIFRKNGGSRILNSQQLAEFLSAGSRSTAGVNVTPGRALQLGTVFACVRVLAESVGQLPFHLYEQKGREKEKALTHPLYSLLHDAPNEYQTAQEWREFVIASLALWGNSYNQIIRRPASSVVLELLPMRPESTSVRQDPNSLELTYEYRQKNGQTLKLAAAEVLHLKLMPLDGYCGASPVAFARDAIGLAIATEQHGAGLFARGASPGGVLTHPKTLSKDAKSRLREEWEQTHAGADNSHRVAVLEEGLAWTGITMPSKDAQFLETRQYQREEVAGLYRVPPHFIGDLSRATFSNIEHQSLDFVVHGLMPYLTRIEARVALQLLSPDERGRFFAKFQVGGLLRGDMAARSAFYTSQVQNGALSPNEIREFEDQNPREGGDVYLQPANMVVSGSKPLAASDKPPAK